MRRRLSGLTIGTTLSLCLAAAPVWAQTNTSETTQVIVKASARPHLSEEVAPPPISDFIVPPRIEQIALSPDGSRFAFITRKAGLRLLTVYNVDDGSNQVIRLSEDPLSALTFLDNDFIVLSDTRTASRSTCPSGLDKAFKAPQSVDDYRSALTDGGFGSGATNNSGASEDWLIATMISTALTPPPCRSYGVRAHEAAAIVDLRTRQSISLGARMGGDYDQMPLGLPKPVMMDGKLTLVGPFLELRDKSIAGQVAQRVYLWKVDPQTGRGRIIDDKGGDLDREGSYVDDWLTDDKGQPQVRAQYTYIGETFAIEVRQDGKWKPLLTRKIDAKAHTFAPFLVGRGRDGQSLLLLDAAPGSDGKRFHYVELSLDGKVSEPLNEDAARDRPVFHPQTGALAGFAHDGEVTTYTFFDADLADYYSHAVDTAPGQAVRVAAMASDPAKMILFAQGGDDPGSWAYYDFIKGKRVDIGSHYPDVPPEWVASQRTVRYAAADGLTISALVTLPRQGEVKKRALVVLPHDGPRAHVGRGYDWLAQVLASRGYVVLQPNYRGSDGYGAALREAGKGQWAGKSLSDLADGVTYLAAQGLIDPKRVCIAGEGYGGYAALKGAQGQTPYRCAASINGIIDPADYLKTARSNAPADAIASLKADPAAPRAFVADALSPALIETQFGQTPPPVIGAADISKPVLLIASPNDAVVPSGQSRALRDALQRAGKPVAFVELPDNGHELQTQASRLSVAQALIDFLAKHNPAK
ncbi:prolyl oligopeptidase family serine peptidase [Asticcacaulis sp. DXS10W]|uniref:Prolyl oligopeptidase family serine peptidase n=1 Tax=Asticcacaulis currens TaxID=2984210 RepID=A0ABT5IDE1_9CAUL|nr:prolyl oligopeptidase family serine peptidase [Asticcacaulis currens]MDC7694202.1 prolyl oligopeptidase family serine peptidase [Asticcacaulis currens]